MGQLLCLLCKQPLDDPRFIGSASLCVDCYDGLLKLVLWNPARCQLCGGRGTRDDSRAFCLRCAGSGVEIDAVPDRTAIPEGWLDTTKKLPPKWTVVDTISHGGIRQPLQWSPPLWFDETNTFWTHAPLCWRPREG